MGRRRLGSIAVGICVSLVGCGSERGDGGDDESGVYRPFRAAWTTVLDDVPFPAEDIRSLVVGGTLERDNFANRGDVIVRFEPRETIKIELRPFTMARSEAGAESTLDDLLLFAATSLLSHPDDIPADADCRTTWKDGCQIRVYYDGATQEDRAGADIRVTLPESYRHELSVTTTDADLDESYHNRGNVCVENLPGTLDVEVQSGKVLVSVAEGTPPMPSCNAADLGACDGWPDGSRSSAWAQDCPCFGSSDGFGRVKIASQTRAMDAIVDVPVDLWTHVALVNRNGGAGGEPAEAPGQFCDALVSVPGFDPQLAERMRIEGTMARPSPGALEGGGYLVSALTDQCAAVTTTETPDGFVGNGEQAVVERGNLEVCTDCLRAQPCEALLPGQ
jgi:hypothetical protein